ncbi:hypothetical protein M407DRAFT_189794 [Tulasnella calospora MUT 4182]|uniref:Uncharacterized protein n=1 Tax=Tulasnella calospora MUT 4182 TaxID=1051891 RepID=A0A0C3Q1F5_9AGAM|nr:hypothetical protein M407DRAFT_189794 [Tulasnella calospora MUT 4182]
MISREEGRCMGENHDEVTASSSRGIHNEPDESKTRNVHRAENSIPIEEERGTNPCLCAARKKRKEKQRVANPYKKAAPQREESKTLRV